MFSHLAHLFIEPFHYLVDISQRIHILYLLAYLLIAYLVYLGSRPSAAFSNKNFWNFCFPKSIYFHRSAKVDYVFFYFTRILFLILPSFVLGSAAAASFFYNLLYPLMKNVHMPDMNIVFMNVLFTVVSLVAADLALFISHYLSHKIPVLWEFHKVHHSAEVLTPLTVYRMHPLDDVLTMTCVGLFTGFVQAVFFWVFPQKISEVTLFGFNIAYFIYYLAGYNLRHSHIWLSYGPFLSRILISPAQHQIHHSTNPEHYDKNFGFIFAFWDIFTRSLIVPKEKLNIEFGLSNGEAKEFSSALRLLFLPFKKVFYHKKTILIILCLFGLSRASFAGQNSVFLEDLTWMEVGDAVKSGKTVAIIPTGGTEQNGTHMILGKHNYIVRHTAEEIAAQLGNALVAPVVAYVPEGDIQKKEGHMAYPGTISVPEPIFKETLKSAARSLFAHGFTRVCFVGDSGDNQASQEKAAGELNAEFSKSGKRALSVSDYYSRNGAEDYLLKKGYSKETIRAHAGIRDTSELMAVRPEGIRDASKASAEFGSDLIKLKVAAAVSQIRKFLGKNDA